MTIYDHITRDHEMSSRTRATIDDLRAQVAKLEAQLADARADFDSLEDEVAAVVRAHVVYDERGLDEALNELRDSGRDGWWKKTDAPREPPSLALRARLAAVEAERDATRDAVNSVTREFDDLAALHARNARTLEHAHDRALASGASNAYEHASYLFRKRAEVTK